MFSRQAEGVAAAFRYLSFLSRYPSPPVSPEVLGRSFIYFPMVGFVFGTGLMISYYLLSHFLDEEVACLFLLLLMFLFFDGKQHKAFLLFLKSAVKPKRPPEGQAPEPTDDPLALSALFFLLMLKFLALVHIGKGWILSILVLIPTFSCWSLVYFSHSLGFSSLAKTERFSHLRYVRAREFWGATFFTAAAAALIMELEGLFFLMFVSLWTALFERFFSPKRPESADAVLWTVAELNEVSMLLVALIMQKGFSMMTSEGVWL